MNIQVDGETILVLSDIDISCLDNDILDKEDWLIMMITGQVNQSKKRMIREWQPKLFADSKVESIPATAEGMIAMIIARDDYKTRIERKTEQE